MQMTTLHKNNRVARLWATRYQYLGITVYQLFSGRSLRTVTAVCHISLSRS